MSMQVKRHLLEQGLVPPDVDELLEAYLQPHKNKIAQHAQPFAIAAHQVGHGSGLVVKPGTSSACMHYTPLSACACLAELTCTMHICACAVVLSNAMHASSCCSLWLSFTVALPRSASPLPASPGPSVTCNTLTALPVSPLQKYQLMQQHGYLCGACLQGRHDSSSEPQCQMDMQAPMPQHGGEGPHMDRHGHAPQLGSTDRGTGAQAHAEQQLLLHHGSSGQHLEHNQPNSHNSQQQQQLNHPVHAQNGSNGIVSHKCGPAVQKKPRKWKMLQAQRLADLLAQGGTPAGNQQATLATAWTLPLLHTLLLCDGSIAVIGVPAPKCWQQLTWPCPDLTAAAATSAQQLAG
jgi:hypothetical protein